MKKIMILCIVFIMSMRTVITSNQQFEKTLIPSLENIQSSIEHIFNTTTELHPSEQVIKITIPRNDKKVTIHSWPLPPFMGLSSWISFQQTMPKTMVMGDLVLFENEINTAIHTALNNGIKVTALHNHFLYDHPKVYFMHFEGEDAIMPLAHNVNKIITSIKHIPHQKRTPLPKKNAIQGASLENILSLKGTMHDGMIKFVIGRETQAGCGCTIGKNMGIHTWFAFGGTNNNARVDGDFALLENELQTVLKILTASNIHILAIHNHMINENPRMLFVHFWGQGKASDLAQCLKNALDITNSSKGTHETK